MTISDSLSSRTLTDASLATLATKPSTGGLVDSEPANFQNIWSQILQDVQDSTKTTPPKTLILLGDNESGRSTLISRLKGVETIRKGIGLEYNYIDIKDDDRDGIYLLNRLFDVLIKYQTRCAQVECMDTGWRRSMHQLAQVCSQRVQL